MIKLYSCGMSRMCTFATIFTDNLKSFIYLILSLVQVFTSAHAFCCLLVLSVRSVMLPAILFWYYLSITSKIWELFCLNLNSHVEWMVPVGNHAISVSIYIERVVPSTQTISRHIFWKKWSDFQHENCQTLCLSIIVIILTQHFKDIII